MNKIITSFLLSLTFFFHWAFAATPDLSTIVKASKISVDAEASPPKLSTINSENLQNLPKPPSGIIPESLEKAKEKNSTSLVLTDVTKPILLSPGQKTLIINLQSNPTTGYSWFLKGGYDHNFILIHAHQYLAPSSKLIGAGGVDQWVFDVNPEIFVAPISTTLNFVYKKPWENTDAKTLAVEVIS